jgi:hypothetical protein
MAIKQAFRLFCLLIFSCMSVTIDGFGLEIGFIDYLQFVITSNPNTIANFPRFTNHYSTR